MKKLLLITIVFFYLNTDAQTEHLNQNLLKTSDVYGHAASYLMISQMLIESSPDRYNSFLKADNNAQNRISLEGSLLAEQKNWRTHILIKVNDNLIICCVTQEVSSGVMEVALMKMTNGDIYEIDYGITNKYRIYPADNIYTEQLTLPHGGSVIFENHDWVRAFSWNGLDGMFWVKEDYFFLPSK